MAIDTILAIDRAKTMQLDKLMKMVNEQMQKMGFNKEFTLDELLLNVEQHFGKDVANYVTEHINTLITMDK